MVEKGIIKEGANLADAAWLLEGFLYSTDRGAELKACAPCARFSLRMEAGDLPGAAKAFGQSIPWGVGEMSVWGSRLALCLGPDEWLLIVPMEAAGKLVADFKPLEREVEHGIVDISDSQAGIEITGRKGALLLGAGCPLDLEAMGADRCARSILEGVQVVVMKFSPEHYRVEIARSHAEYVRDFLVQAAGDI